MLKNSLSFFKKIVSIGMKYPFQLVKSINRKNLTTLLNALKNEPPHQIIRNFYLLLISSKDKIQEKNYQFISLPHQVHLWTDAEIESFQEGEIFTKCTTATLVANEFYIEGWVLSKETLDKVEIYTNNLLIGTATYGIERLDVSCGHEALNVYQNCGYQLSKTIKIDQPTIKIKITTESGQVVEDILQLEESFQYLEREQQYPIFLEKRLLANKDATLEDKTGTIFRWQPLLSIILVIEEDDPSSITECVCSILKQAYPNWELCIHLNERESPHVFSILGEWRNEERIKISTSSLKKDKATRLNKLIDTAEGEYIVLIKEQHELIEDALYEVVRAINQNTKIDFLYSDEDRKDMAGQLCCPHFKPDFSLDLLLSTNYIGQFVIVKKELGDQVSWFRTGFEGAENYDLYLRISQQTENIFHIPNILYHQRVEKVNKDILIPASVKVLESYLLREGISGEVLLGQCPGTFRIKRNIVNQELVSIIIPFKDQVSLLENCLNSILEKTIYVNYEILLISNNSEEEKTFKYIKELKQKQEHIHFFEYNIVFNYSKINNWGIRKAKGKYVLLLNNDTEIINKGWLSAMVEHIQVPRIGAVGAKLLYQDNTIQHAGVVLNIQGSAGHIHKFFPAEASGYLNRIQVIQNFSACTGACLLLKKDLYLKVGGLDEDHLKISFSDVDLCLKLKQEGGDTIYTPYAELYHYESKSRSLKKTAAREQQFWRELHFFRRKWQKLLEKGDPFYSKSLTLDKEDMKLNLHD